MNENLPKILVIEDEPQIRKLLNLTLTAKGFKIYEAFNGREGISFVSNVRPDLILLDIGLPDMSGLEVLNDLRTWTEVPVIVLSVQDDSDVIIGALNSGADDYVTKPFEAGQLLARINVCLRRNLRKGQQTVIFETRNLRVNLESRIVTKNGEEIKLTSTEYDLLKLFVQNADKILTTRQILKEVWGPLSLEQSQYPRVYVRHLRQKLEDNPDNPVLFLTEPGVGYRLKTKE